MKVVQSGPCNWLMYLKKIKNNTTFTCSCLNGAKALVIDCEVSHQNATPFLLEGNSMHYPVYIQ